jgi:hypothetical protein
MGADRKTLSQTEGRNEDKSPPGYGMTEGWQEKRMS